MQPTQAQVNEKQRAHDHQQASGGTGGGGITGRLDQSHPDFTRASSLTNEVSAEIDRAFEYRPWDSEMTQRGTLVRTALADAVKVIVANVPPSADRSSAIRMIRQARMECNSAITHNGKY